MENDTSVKQNGKKRLRTINSRNKGASAEREFIKLIKEQLGEAGKFNSIKRNLEQTRSGGHDITGVADWALEVKRYASVTDGRLKKWWEQTTTQAKEIQMKPALAYKQDYGSWKVKIPLRLLDSNLFNEDKLEWTTDMSVSAWCSIVREYC